MTRITEDTTESKPNQKVQDGIENANEQGGSDDLEQNTQKVSINGEQKYLEASEKAAEQPVALVLALFYDGFVCRHMTKENEGVEGFAQPYDAESSYFLACIDNGRVPEGLPEMIACAHYNGSVVAEIRDYRELRTALCPVSSSFLPAASAQLLTDSEIESGCRVWHAILLPGKSPLPIHPQVAPQLEPPTLQSMFDHFPDVHPNGNELLYGKPAWVTIAHVGRFFRAATRLEREHSRFLHTNARRLMQAEKTSPADTEHVAGSMRYLARQLGDLSRPSDVIAVASARDMRAAEDEGRELRAPDWVDIEEQSPSPTWQASVALVSPANEPTLLFGSTSIDPDQEKTPRNIVDNASLIGDYQPTAATPHFNAFDEDGNLQLQSA
ncbi:hypothetical protein PInf_025705 [Phytophthora infestans]|nr:hypothetical protein PInf_025705 [Phytophthora infestans]